MAQSNITANRKDQIIHATLSCIRKQGYHNFSMQDVAKKAGVSKGIIHYYFLNKDTLMLSVLETVVLEIEELLQKELLKTHKPEEKLIIFIELCLSLVQTTKQYYQVNIDFWTQINQKKDVSHIIAKHYQKFRNICTSILEEGMKQKVFQKHDSHQYSSFILAAIDGISLQTLFDTQAFNYNEMVKKTSSWLIKGILTGKTK